IPVNNEPDFLTLSDSRLKIENHYLPSGIVEVTVDSQQYHLYKSVGNDENHLIVESLNPISLDAFKKASDSIITGYALVSGNLHLGEYYYHVINDSFNSEQFLLYEKREPAS